MHNLEYERLESELVYAKYDIDGICKKNNFYFIHKIPKVGWVMGLSDCEFIYITDDELKRIFELEVIK